MTIRMIGLISIIKLLILIQIIKKLRKKKDVAENFFSKVMKKIHLLLIDA